jgi:hypothetical protein
MNKVVSLGEAVIGFIFVRHQDRTFTNAREQFVSQVRTATGRT